MHFTSGSASLGHYEYSMSESERPNDSCSLNISVMKETNVENRSHFFLKKRISSSSSFFPSFFLLFSALVCSDLPWASFDTPWQWLWSINHLFPELSVPACSEMKQQPLDHRHCRFQPFLLDFPAKTPTPSNRTLLWCCIHISNHLVCFQAKYR